MKSDYIIKVKDKKSGEYINFTGVYQASKGYDRKKAKARFDLMTEPHFPNDTFALFERETGTSVWVHVEILK